MRGVRPGSKGRSADVYPGLKKISVDFAVMEKASRDPAVQVAAVPMALSWKDIGSWPAFAETCPMDDEGNRFAAEKHVLLDTKGTLVVSSDPGHLIAALRVRRPGDRAHARVRRSSAAGTRLMI